VLIVVLLAVSCLAAGFWFYVGWGPNLPEVPQLDLAGADPEVADAIDKARAAVVKAPHSVDAWQRLAMTLHAHSYRAQAAVCYEAAGLLDAHNPMYPYMRGVILESSMEPKDALPCYEKAVALSGPIPLPRLRLADLLLQLGRFDEAEALYRKVLEADARNVWAQFGLGQLSAAQQKYEDAVGRLQAAADNKSAQKRACALLAVAFQHLGDTAAAERERSRLAELPEDETWPDPLQDQLVEFQVGLRVLLRQASSLTAQKRNSEATALLREVVVKYPQSDRAWADLGKLLANANDHDGAERAMRKSIELAPGSTDHWLSLGVLLQARRQMKDAAAAFRKAAELWPTDATAHFKLGVCLQEQGDRAGAVNAFRQAIRCRPDIKEAREHLAKLGEK
jgi:tetratricopeptide (TPR) repeat protein